MRKFVFPEPGLPSANLGTDWLSNRLHPPLLSHTQLRGAHGPSKRPQRAEFGGTHLGLMGDAMFILELVTLATVACF